MIVKNEMAYTCLVLQTALHISVLCVIQNLFYKLLLTTSCRKVKRAPVMEPMLLR